MPYFVDVLLPLPLKNTFTYRINDAEARFLQLGMRLSVPFGKSKLVTGIVLKIHETPPLIYEAKEIDSILDNTPLVLKSQLQFWYWVATYYMCQLGEVFKASLPSILLLQGETIIKKKGYDLENEDEKVDLNNIEISDDEFLLLEALQFKSSLKIDEVSKILNKKNVLPIIKNLFEKQQITVDEYVEEKYIPKIEKSVVLHEGITQTELPKILESLKNAPKQREVLLQFFNLQNRLPCIKSNTLLKEAKATAASLKGLIKKNILALESNQVDRVQFSSTQTSETIALSQIQETALQQIETSFKEKEVCLLHGVTASGKTEIYIKLIEKQLMQQKQVLFLVPEIALSTQLISRLQVYFGDYLVVYHSKYSANERVEAYYTILKNKDKPQLIIGVRSSLFLPFSHLGLVIVDESHEGSYKQFDPAPRYHGRDAAIALGSLSKAKVLLGSATPSIESYYNTVNDKFGLVNLKKRHKGFLFPEINLIDLKVKQKKRLMKGHFSDTLLEAIEERLLAKEQVIIFQNKRGFSSIQDCTTCGYIPQCVHCDVSLTYHKHSKQLRCHYCGYQIAEQTLCRSCGSDKLSTKGFGTEQVEQELSALFPKANIGRMDQDTTRGKYGHQKIINQFQEKEIDILVGTQMLAKGFDFKNVTLVGVMNADSQLFFPDYRAQERTYQLLSQVAGRAGRSSKKGLVLIQTYNPLHQVLQQVTVSDYTNMYKDQLLERKQHHYAPFVRMIRFTLKHRDFNKVNDASDWFAKALRQGFNEYVLGPEYPAISRIRNQYNKNIMLKIPRSYDLKKVKSFIRKQQGSFESIKTFSGVRISIHVDHT